MDLSRRHPRRSHGAHASITYQALKIVSIAFSLNRSPGNAVAEKNRGNHFGARGFILAGRCWSVWINHSGQFLICMNTFLTRSGKAVRASRDGIFSSERAEWLWFFSRALCLTSGAQAMTMHLVSITTGIGTDRNKLKPWIVRVIRVRRRRRKTGSAAASVRPATTMV